MMMPPPPFGTHDPSTAAGSLPPVGPNGASAYDASAALSMESMMQMQQQMGMPVSMYGFPSGVVGPWNGNGNGDDSGRRRRRRCRFFEKKGYCTRANCQYDHGEAEDAAAAAAAAAADGHGSVFSMMPPPAVAAAMLQQMMPQLPQQRGEAAAEMQGPQGAGRRVRKGGRAPFSADGPVYDRSNSTVVIEGIPDENLNEAAVREFFTQFGPIASVSMQAKRKLAVVKFDEWTAANAAYHSPKVIFDNRFVKVFWHKEKGNGVGGAGDEANGTSAKKAGGSAAETEEGEVVEGEGEMPEMDMEDFLRRQEEAQKRHEEKVQMKQELEHKRQELEQRQRALQARQQEERQRLIAKMAAVATRARQGSESGTPSEAGGGGGGDGDGDSNGNGNGNGESKGASFAAISQTEMIRAQLAALEEEARQLGLDPDSITSGDSLSSSPALPSWRGRGRGHGRGGRSGAYTYTYTYRGRGGRGGFAARGGLHGSVSSSVASAYAAYSLDNRPRRIAVTGVDFTAPEQNEALRQYLLVGCFLPSFLSFFFLSAVFLSSSHTKPPSGRWRLCGH